MSYAGTFLQGLQGLLISGALAACLGSAAQAQDGSVVKPKFARSATETFKLRRPGQLTDVRGLTINKRPERVPSDDFDDGENSATIDGPTRYNSISTFDPVPYVDSGIQYPYGLDGIGGYGSDIGVQAGHDTALYQRGP